MEIITVIEGDTVFSIASRYGLSVEKIISDNGLDANGLLVTGQSLVLVFPETVYTAAIGDTVSSVADRFGTSERDIYRNNYFLMGQNALSEGDKIVISYESPPTLTKILAGYAYDFISNALLESVISYLTYLIPFTYGFTPSGELISPNDERLISTAYRYSAKPLMHLSTLTSGGFFSNDLAHELLMDPEAVSRLAGNVLENIIKKGYYGVDIDFEYLFEEDKEAYISFIERVTTLLNSEGYICIVALPPKVSDDQPGLLYAGIDYARLGAAANYAFCMTYEWGYRFGPPLAVAPINSLRRVVEYAVSRIPNEKILLGISNYGYDWTLPYVRGESDAQSLSTVEALNIALYYNSEIQFDKEAQSPYFFYTDSEGSEHVIWFEDARSFAAKVEVIREFDLAGGSIWDLMRHNPQGFVTLNSLIDII